jgi:pimeloyl-ACP methyl ester carboxylesterase
MAAVSDFDRARLAVPEAPQWRDVYFTVRDGLRLYARHYPASQRNRRRPLVCLPAITRNSRDFHDLAVALANAGEFARDVYALDYRGRGRSEHDADWRNYTPFFEMLDVLDFLALTRLHDAAFLGTSRGGVIAMILATVRPAAIGAVILNDIGPVVEPTGLMRTMGFVGRIPVPKDWTEATRIVRELHRQDFPRISDELWEDVARQWFEDVNGAPGAAYDNALSKSFSLSDLVKGIDPMWPQFSALAHVPMLVIRGENSDILSPKTVEEMTARHPDLETLSVAGQGHAPFLKDEHTIGGIAAFLAKADRTYYVIEPVAVQT